MYLTFVFGQTNQVNNPLNIRGGNGDTHYYIDGFRVYYNLSKEDSNKVLKDLVINLNGTWKSDTGRNAWKYQLSEESFKGKLLNKREPPSAPLIRLEIINGQVKLVKSTLRGIDSDTSNIRITNNELIIDDFIYHRQK